MLRMGLSGPDVPADRLNWTNEIPSTPYSGPGGAEL